MSRSELIGKIVRLLAHMDTEKLALLWEFAKHLL